MLVNAPTMDVKALGGEIRKLRVARGLSLAELGRAARLDRSDLWRIENGTGPRQVGWDRLERLASALGVEVPDLLPRPRKRRRAALAKVSGV